MGPHVSEATAGELAILPPRRVVPVHSDGAENAVEVPARGTSQPSVPIRRGHVLRERFRREITWDRGIADADVHPLDGPDRTVADELRGSNEVAAELAPLLTSNLERNTRRGGGIGDGPAFLDGSRERLLAVSAARRGRDAAVV